MNKLIMPAAFFSLWLLVGCVGSRVEAKPSKEPALTPASYDKMKNAAQSGGKPLELAGYYFRTEVCRSLSLILLPKGNYSLTWHGCQGLNGTAVGTWRSAGSELFLDPAEEEGILKDNPVRHLDILMYEGIHILVWDADKEAFLQDGPRMRTCFAPARSFPW